MSLSIVSFRSVHIVANGKYSLVSIRHSFFIHSCVSEHCRCFCACTLLIFFFFSVVVLGIEPKTLYILGKRSTTELTPSLSFFMFWLLWKILQWGWECRYLYEMLISLFLSVSSEELLCHIVVLFLISLGTSTLFFHNGCVNLCLHQ